MNKGLVLVLLIGVYNMSLFSGGAHWSDSRVARETVKRENSAHHRLSCAVAIAVKPLNEPLEQQQVI